MTVNKQSRELEVHDFEKNLSFSGSKNCDPIVAQVIEDLKMLERRRQYLFRKLESFDGLPPDELKEQYYQIHPQIQSVYREIKWKSQQLHQNI